MAGEAPKHGVTNIGLSDLGGGVELSSTEGDSNLCSNAHRLTVFSSILVFCPSFHSLNLSSRAVKNHLQRKVCFDLD